LPDVGFLYAERTSQDFQPGSGEAARLIKSIAFRYEARRLIKEIGVELEYVIDFACGSGLFTRCFAESLPGVRVVGTDFHARPPADLGCVEYRSLAGINEMTGVADLVLAMHVVEHDDDPQALLGSIVRLIRPGGYLVVETPNIDCAWISVFGRMWDAWYLPYHRIHLNRIGLRTLVEASGLTVIRESDVSVPVIGRTISNILGRRNNLSFILLGAALHPLQWAVERLTRRPSAVRIIARKAWTVDQDTDLGGQSARTRLKQR